MYSYRISKYNPAYRDKDGRFEQNDWTSFSDIGSIYKNREFTIEDYIKVEDAYVNTVIAFMNCLNVPSLRACEIEKNNRKIKIDKFYETYSEEMKDLYSSIREGDILKVSDVKNLVRLVLREQLWCKLEYNSTMYVHFGYDYYMYIGSSEKCGEKLPKIIQPELFAEDFESPYEG